MAKKPAPNHDQPKPKIGRPPTFTAEIWDELLKRHSNGETLPSICRSNPERYPASDYVYEKGRDDDTFARRLAHARGLHFDALFDQAIDIAAGHSRPRPTKLNAKGVPVVDLMAHKADVHRDRLHVDTIMRYIAMGNPAKYGQRVAVHHSGAIDMGGVDDATLNARIERKLLELGVGALFQRWKLAEERVKEFFALFRVTELPTAPAVPRLLPGEKEIEL